MKTTVNSALLLCIASCFLFSCKKDCKPVETCTETGSWSGTYGSEYSESSKVADSTFIKDGVARLTNSPWSYFYSSIELAVPDCRTIDADTVIFEVSLKNAPKDAWSIADYDASLWMYGSKDTAHVQYIGYRAEFTSFGLNNKQIINSSNLLNVFADWTTVSLEANNKKLVTKKSGVAVETISYDGLQIGSLKKLTVAFKGAGSVDWVKLYSSKSNALLMKEDFDEDGKSSVVWY